MQFETFQGWPYALLLASFTHYTETKNRIVNTVHTVLDTVKSDNNNQVRA